MTPFLASVLSFYLAPGVACLVLFALWPLREGRFKPLDWLAMAFFTLVPFINLVVSLVFSYAVVATVWRSRH